MIKDIERVPLLQGWRELNINGFGKIEDKDLT